MRKAKMGTTKMIRFLLLMTLMFALPSVGVAQDDVVKCIWWGPFTAVGEDMRMSVAHKEASVKASAGLQTIIDHLPDDWFVAGYRSSHNWTRGNGGTHILTIRYEVRVCKWIPLPIPDLPKKGTIWR